MLRVVVARFLRFLLLCSCLHAPSAHAHHTLKHVVVTQARYASGACGTAQSNALAVPVTLPDSWRERGIPAPNVACYRAEFELADVLNEVWGMRIDRMPGNHRVRVNGALVTTRGMDGSAITSVANLPYLIEIPPQLLHAGKNQVEIEMRVGGYRQAGLAPIDFAPVCEQRPGFDWWDGATRDGPQVVNLAIAGIACFLLIVWRARPGDHMFGYFGALMIVMSLRNAAYFVESSPLPPSLVDWLFYSAQAWTMALLACFGLTYSHINLRPYRWYILGVGLGLPLIAAWPSHAGVLTYLRLGTYPALMATGLVAIYNIWRTASKRSADECLALNIGMALALVSALHDYLFLTPWLSITDLSWTPYTTPVIFTAYSFILMRKFLHTVNQAERLNVRLEERVAERTLALEAANRAKTRFLAAASHDLRQPTTAISLLVGLLRKRADRPEITEVTRMLDEAVSALESLLVGLLDISRLDAGSVKPEFLAVSLQSVFQSVQVHEQSNAQAKGLKLRFRLPARDADLILHTDPALIDSVVRNLVANAIRYTERGGVLVTARRRGKRRLLLQVWDTGIGIAPEHQTRVFEEFFQVDNEARDRSRGIGLGLAIVQRTANILGEHVTLRSRPGCGSCFSIELPLSEYQPRVAPPPRPKDLPLAGQRVWLVEDDGLVREALTERLQHWGATVHAWGDAESLLRDWPAHLPHVLVTDYRLPGLDGLGLLQAVARRVGDTAAQIKTLLVSGDTDPHVLAQLNASGYPVLSKPFRPERMLERLDIGLI